MKRATTAGAWLLLFAVIVAMYVATFSFRNISDTDLNSLQTRALALHGDVDLARYRDILPQPSHNRERDGHVYSIYGVGVSLTALPIYAVAARMDLSDKTLQAAAAVPFVAAGAVILLRLLLRLFPRPIAVGSSIVYAFGTTMWPLAAMGFFQHGPASLFQAIGLTGLFSDGRRAAAIAGFGFGVATLVRPTLFVPLAVVGLLYLVESRRSLFLYAAAAIPPLLAVLVQNRWIWGTWLKGGYAEVDVGYQGDVPRALWGLLFGWYRGLFVYSPVLILAVVGAAFAFKKLREPFERRLVALAVSAVALVLVYSRFTTWYGGTTQFGYRYLLDVVPFAVVLMAYGLARSERVRTIALPLGLLSVMTMAFGAGPDPFGFDGPLLPKGIVRTSLGNSWITFVHEPLGGILRVLGVAAIGALMYLLAPGERSRMSSREGASAA